MTLDPRLEQDLRRRLSAELDMVPGPDPTWATSPAARTVAADRTRHWTRPIVALAAVLGGGAVAAILLSGGLRPPEAAAGCPTLASVAAASDAPRPPSGAAPDVSFPPVGPTASATTGTLELGTWAVLAGRDGPGGLMRIRDVIACDRLPDARSLGSRDGSYLIGTVDFKLLDGGSLPGWLGPGSILEGQIDGRGIGSSLAGRHAVVPGADDATVLDPKPGFSVSTRFVMEVPAPGFEVIAAYPGRGTPVNGTEPATPDDTHLVGWRLRAGALGPMPTADRDPSPASEPSRGRLDPGDVATFRSGPGLTAVLVSDVERVARYPALEPSAGHEFVEVRVAFPASAAGVADVGAGSREWRAVGAGGETLPFVPESAASSGGVLAPLMPEDRFAGARWLVIDAPTTGPLTLEFRLDGQGPVLFTYDLRAEAAPAAS